MIRKYFKFYISLTVIMLVSCKNETTKEPLYPESENELSSVELGKEIFEGKGMCYSCHVENKKIIGPSITEIGTIYKAKNADMVTFLKGEGKPIVDPSQYEIMQTNFAITKNLPEKELKALEDYMLGFAK